MRNLNPSKLVLASAGFIFLFAGSVSYAQLAIEEVIVTAQKRKQSLQDVPISVEAITADTLQRRAINDTRTLAQAAPSLNFQDGFGPVATNFNIRGLGSYTIEGGLQPSVSMVVDGVPYARNGEFVTELSDIEQIEVLRGPQGTLYGRNSTGGAINITTLRPGEEFEGYVDLSFTTDNEQLYRASVSGPLTDNMRGSLLGFYKDRDGHIENIFPGSPDLGGEETAGGRVKLDIDFNDSLNLLLTGDYMDSTHGFSPQVPNTAEDLGIAAGGTFLRELLQGDGDVALGQSVIADRGQVNQDGTLNSDNETENYGISGDFTWKVNDSLTVRSISAYREWKGLLTVDVDSGPARAVNRNNFGPLLSDIETNINRNNPDNDHTNNIKYDYFSQELRLEGSNDRLDWTAGFYYLDFEEAQGADVELYVPIGLFGAAGGADGNPLNDTGMFVTSSIHVARNEVYAFFADVTVHATDTIDIFGGFRWTEEQLDVDFDSLTVLAADVADGFVLNANTYDLATNTATIDLTNPGVLQIPGGGPDEADNGDWSGRAGIFWRATEDLNFYASASRSFIGFGTNLGRSGAPGATAFVEPTTAESYEIGFKSRWGGNVQLNAAIYLMDVTDLQTTVLLPGLITVPINAGNLDTLGVEADLVWSITDNARLTAGMAYTDAEIKDLQQPCYPGQSAALGCVGGLDGPGLGDNVGSGGLTDVAGTQAPNTPEFKFNLALDLDVPMNGMPFDGFANVAYTWQDDVHFTLNNDPLLAQEDYGLLDFTVGIMDKKGKYEISFFGKNVTDKFHVGAMRENIIGIARAFHRTPRAADAYFGGRIKYNF